MPKLPEDILKKRIQHEINLCKRRLEHEIVLEDPTISRFPLRIFVTLIRTPGPVIRDKKLEHKMKHKFVMNITDVYPYQKPIVQWQSLIFHPNIMLPQDGGRVCTKLLDDWKFGSNLLTFIKGIESLLVNPNGQNPFGTDSCTMAAEYFNKHKYEPPIVTKPLKQPQIVTGETVKSVGAEVADEHAKADVIEIPPTHQDVPDVELQAEQEVLPERHEEPNSEKAQGADEIEDKELANHQLHQDLTEIFADLPQPSKTPETPELSICKFCNNEMPPGSRYCNSCGREIQRGND